MKRLLIVILALMALLAMALPAQAQHGENIGHLPPVQKNIQVLGKLDLFTDEEQPGRIADVSAYGDYAYLGAFASPNCENPGVYVIDISDPTNPKEADFIPTSTPGAFVGEGVQVLEMNTESYKGPLLLYSQETCLPNGGPVLGSDPRLGLAGRGGATLVDVRNPLEWEKLADHVGDEDPSEFGFPHNSHSVFGWQQGDRAYMIVMDNGETTDIDIFDITNPAAPEFVVETGFPDFPEVNEDPPPNGASPFVHDFVVKKVGNQWLLLASYWDGGYIIIDVTDLENDNVTFLRDTDFGPEPFAAELGLPASTPSEGNGHQAEFNFDSSMFIGADEDFQAFRFLGEITSGTFAGDTFSGIPGSDTPPIPEGGLEGPTTFVGGACGFITPAPTSDHIALIDRDPGCSFTVKVNAADAAGYKAAIIFNNRTTDAPNCDASINMTAIGNIPSLGVGRSTGLKLLNVDPGPDSCATPSPAAGTPSESVKVGTLFDGWGYMHLYDANTMQAIDHWALPEGLTRAMATDHGDLTVHEVAMDPARNRAYVSHYAGGMRVFDFSRKKGLVEVGAFIDQGGSNFWGTEVHDLGGKYGQAFLGSDRDSGLYIFQFKPGVGKKKCRGERTTYIGSRLRDRIKGTGDRDVIRAGGGNDRVSAGKGRDFVCGQKGDDRVVGGSKKDKLHGGPGKDVLVGGGGHDICLGGRGPEKFRGCEVERG